MEATVNKSYLNLGIAVGLISLAVVLRLLPHPANFAPIAAIAIFGGAILPRSYAILVPLAAIIVSDLAIGLHDLIPVTWGAYALIAAASSGWLKQRSFVRVASLTLGGSLFFFFVTNLAVWQWSGMYDRTLAGLLSCFELAVPFFRNTLLSDAVYTAGLFGLYKLALSISTAHLPVSSSPATSDKDQLI